MNISKPDGTVLQFRSLDDCLTYQAKERALKVGATSQDWTGQPVGSGSGSPTPQHAAREQQGPESKDDVRRHGVTKAVPTPTRS